jgi:integrase
MRARAVLRSQKELTFMKKHGYVFENPNTGEPYHEARPFRESFWTPTLKRLGIRHRGSYHTRHTYATAMIMAGCNERWLAKQLGNSPAMIRRHYSTWLDRQDNGRQRAIQDAAFGGAETKGEKSA